MAALERLRARIPEEVPVVADGKRGDIGSTAARQATALFDVLGCRRDHRQPVPRGGGDHPAPRARRSVRLRPVPDVEPGGGEVQGLRVEADPATAAPEEPLHARIARRATGWGPGGTVGLVVRATAPEELRAIRAVAPERLIAGLGAQGGEWSRYSRPGRRPLHRPAGAPAAVLVNVSQGIAGAASSLGGSRPRDPLERVAEAAREWAGRLPVLP